MQGVALTRLEFQNTLKELHPSITLLSKYKNKYTKVQARCKVCAHIWLSKPVALLKGCGCLNCEYAARTKTHEEFSSQLYSIDTNIRVTGNYLGAAKKLEVSCKTCEYSWTPLPTNLLRGQTKCPNCVGNARISHKDFVLLVSKYNPTIRVIGRYKTANTPIELSCINCNYRWTNNARYAKNAKCSKCFNKKQVSRGEKDLASFVASLEEISCTNRKLLKGVELDIVVPRKKACIEYNGMYWHSSKRKHKYYHRDKSRLVAGAGYTLFHISEFYWNNFQSRVKHFLKQELRGLKSVDGRNLVFKRLKIDEVLEEFFSNYHIQGFPSIDYKNSRAYGLLKGDTLVSCMLFSRIDNGVVKILGYASRFNVKNGKEIIFKSFIDVCKNTTKVIYVSNTDYETGQAYEALGFKLCRELPPSCTYWDGHKNFSKIAKPVYKIYDSGKKKWEYTREDVV